MTSCIGKEKEHMFMVPDQFSEQISISSNVENGHGWIESDTVLYETLPGKCTEIFIFFATFYYVKFHFHYKNAVCDTEFSTNITLFLF